jgi:hypothetical protein
MPVAKRKLMARAVSRRKLRRRKVAGVGVKRATFRKLKRIVDDAIRRSRESERSIRVVVDVPPRGVPEITSEDNPVELDRALAEAHARGGLQVAQILSCADMLSAEEFAARVGASRVTVNEWRQSHKILGIQGAKRGFRFPEWQLGEDGKPFAALPALFDKLGGSAWAVYRFLVQHHPELDGLTGTEALRRGQSDKVIETAETVTRAFS